MRGMMRFLLPAVPVVMLAVAAWRRLSGAETAEAFAERLGHTPAPEGRRIWLHGASNGELASARWVLEALLAQRPGLKILVTANTATARAMVQGWALPGVTAAFAPLDLRRPLARLLRAWRPELLLTVEGEIYPLRFAACAAAGIPIGLIGARMSARSHQGWKALQPVMARALGRVGMASAQDPGSAGRLRDLGLPLAALRADCDLKAVAIRRLPPPALPPPPADRARWLLAASTHAGEEAAVLAAFQAARGQFDHLILAPRHPRRGDEVAALVAAEGLSLARRSQGASPGQETVFLADTMGEMDLWYARAGACFVGGSLVPRGGHSPWEPARFGAAILHGSSVSNFAAAYASLAAAGGALAVEDAAGLARALPGLDAGAQSRLRQAGAQILGSSEDGGELLKEILSLWER